MKGICDQCGKEKRNCEEQRFPLGDGDYEVMVVCQDCLDNNEAAREAAEDRDAYLSPEEIEALAAEQAAEEESMRDFWRDKQ